MRNAARPLTAGTTMRAVIAIDSPGYTVRGSGERYACPPASNAPAEGGDGNNAPAAALSVQPPLNPPVRLRIAYSEVYPGATIPWTTAGPSYELRLPLQESADARDPAAALIF